MSRTFYSKGQTGQQLLLGAYQALMKGVDAGNITLHTRMEMLEVVLKEDRAAGIVTGTWTRATSSRGQPTP